jgi:diguanylate cyclase (GGDEF)-like protein
MNGHVILLTDAHEAPAMELIEVLRDAGVAVWVEGLREAELEASLTQQHEALSEGGLETPKPLAVLYEVFPGADVTDLHVAIEHAAAMWPEVPTVACRHHIRGAASLNLRVFDGATLKRIGFHAIADKAAQLPALLRQIEERGTTGELRLPESVRNVPETTCFALPKSLRSSDLRSAFELASTLHFATDQRSAAQAVITGLANLVKADRWTIYLTVESGTTNVVGLEALVVRRMGADQPLVADDDWRQALLGDAVLPGGSESKAAREALTRLVPIRRTEAGKRVIALPLISGERVIAVLEAIREEAGAGSFRKSDAGLLEALAAPIGAALANSARIADAERLSQTDDLTKLHNARYLRQYLSNEIRRARRYGSSVSALFFDLDDFKRVNDAHGHLVGSHVLMEMAAVILSSVRDTDSVARYGGDEFVVILPETGLEPAALVADRIRATIERHPFTGGRRLRLMLTASFGVAVFPQHASSPQQLVASADSAMYEAKAASKNCVRFSHEAPRAARKDEPDIPPHFLRLQDKKSIS